MVIFGLPDVVFYILVYCGVATVMAVVFGGLLLMVPPTGKTLLKARLARKKPAVILKCGKASVTAVLAQSAGPGWVQTSEGKKLITPVPPKRGGEDWSPERDVLGKVSLLDGFPCFFTYEAEILAANPEMLFTLEAYSKGFNEEKQLPVHIGNPDKLDLKVEVPVSPKVLAETVGSMLSTEHIDILEQITIEAEQKRRMKSEWGPIIKVAAILGLIFIAGLIVLLIAKSALGV